MSVTKLAALQFACSDDRNENIEKAIALTRTAASRGANVVLLPELFETKYFCQERNYDYYNLATTLENNPAVKAFLPLCKELGIVVPVSFFEKDGNTFFNSVAVLDNHGECLGIYRKIHIPDDHFYQEKFYFTPGNLGHKVWNTEFGNIGVGICWDQWFPETARIMTLMGADMLLYPTAIGSEPILDVDSSGHWQRAMCGHSACNVIPVAAANRIGTESVIPSEANSNQTSSLTFYGSSFITNETGEIVVSSGRDNEEIIYSELDIVGIRTLRQSWGMFRDRRPETYSDLLGN
ncbi:MAG: N-carbamoylputrescine amidase [Lachnospiraceae bacterium]|nr:N-carbamoylputrescine amidase [Lachnospiraceae bacterium]